MNRLIVFFIQRSLIVNLFTAIIVIVGLISVYTLNKETFPNVEFEIAFVRVPYPGASAEEGEKLVGIPYERQLQQVNGIEEMNVLSGEGYVLAALKMDPEYDPDEVVDDIKDAADAVTGLPEDVEQHIVSKPESKERPIIRVALTGPSEEKLLFHARALRDIIERKPGISRVNIDGDRERVFYIEVDREKLERSDLTLSDLASALRDRNVNLSAGSIKNPKFEYAVRTLNEFDTAESIENVIVSSNREGRSLKLKDLAEIEETFKDRDEVERVNSLNSMVLEVVAKSRADILKTTEIAKEAAEKYVKENQNANLNTTYLDELAFYVKRRLGILTSNGLLGILLVFVCLVLFMNVPVALMTSFGAPLAFMVAFAVMDAFGMTINLISMFGLILVLGMLVDDSIIVAENFYQYLEKGEDPEKAAAKAAKETLAPVTSTILTTMVAFGSLFFMGGIMGKFLWSVPAVVIVCLAASWLECFFVLPSHLADFSKILPFKHKKTRWYDPLRNFYRKSIDIALNYRWLTLFSFVAMFLLSLYVAFPGNKLMKFELFPSEDVQVMYVNVRGPVGMSFDRTFSVVESLESVVTNTLDDTELENLRSVVGSQFSRSGTPRRGSHYGMVVIFLHTADKRNRSVDQLTTDLETAIQPLASKEITISIEKRKNGPPAGKAVNIELSGEEIAPLVSMANQALASLKSVPGVLSPEMDYEKGKKQFVVRILEEEARRLGLSNRTIAGEIRRAIQGEIVAEIKRSEEDVDVILRLDESSRSDSELLDKIQIPTRAGRSVLLNRIAKIEESESAFVIRRFDRKRTIAISADISRKETSVIEVNKRVQKFMDKLVDGKTGYSYQLSGENKDTSESVGRLGKAGVISLGIIFLILVLMFSSLIQPMIVMSAIPFGLIGVIGIFFVTGKSIGFMALMGVIGLIGVVVNDSIVLVNFINLSIKEFGITGKKAIVEACVSRFRPVILTTFTTVAGLLPIAHDPAGDPFLKPMALSFAYGLIFSTSLTLIFIPVCYSLVFQRSRDLIDDAN